MVHACMIPWPRLIQAESEINLLQQKLEAQQLAADKRNKQAEEVVQVVDMWATKCFTSLVTCYHLTPENSFTCLSWVMYLTECDAGNCRMQRAQGEVWQIGRDRPPERTVWARYKQEVPGERIKITIALLMVQIWGSRSPEWQKTSGRNSIW